MMPADGLRHHALRIDTLGQSTIKHSGCADENHHLIFGGCWYCTLQNCSQIVAMFAHAQFLQEKSHQLTVPWKTNRFVIQIFHSTLERFCKRPQSTRSIKCFEVNAVDDESFKMFQSGDADEMSALHGFACIDVFIDHAFSRPSQVVSKLI